MMSNNKGYESGAYARQKGIHEEIGIAIATESNGSAALIRNGVSGAFVSRIQVAPVLEDLARAADDGLGVADASVHCAELLKSTGAKKLQAQVVPTKYGARIYMCTDNGRTIVGKLSYLTGKFSEVSDAIQTFVERYNLNNKESL